MNTIHKYVWVSIFELTCAAELQARLCRHLLPCWADLVTKGICAPASTMPPKRVAKAPAKAADAFAALARTGPVKLKRKPFPVLPSATRQLSVAESEAAGLSAATSSAQRGIDSKQTRIASPSGSSIPSVGIKSMRQSTPQALAAAKASPHNASGKGAHTSPAFVNQVPLPAEKQRTAYYMSQEVHIAAASGANALHSTGTISGEVLGMAFLQLLVCGEIATMPDKPPKTYAQSVSKAASGSTDDSACVDQSLKHLLQVSNALVRAEFELSGSDGSVVESTADTEIELAPKAKAARTQKLKEHKSVTTGKAGKPRKRVRFCTFDLTAVDSTQRDVGTSAYILPYTEPHEPQEASELFDIGGKLTQPAVTPHAAAACSIHALDPPLPIPKGGLPAPGAAGSCGVHPSHMLHSMEAGQALPVDAPWVATLAPGVAASLPVPPGVALAYAQHTAVHCAARPGGPERRATAQVALPVVQCSHSMPPPTVHGTPLWLRPPVDALAHALHIVMEAAAAARVSMATPAGEYLLCVFLQQLCAFAAAPPASVQLEAGASSGTAPARGKRARESGTKLARNVSKHTFAAAAETLRGEMCTLQQAVPVRALLAGTVQCEQGLLGTQHQLHLPLLQPYLPFQQRYCECVSSLFRHHLRRAFNCQAWDDVDEQMMQLRLALLQQYGDSDSDEDMAVEDGGEDYMPDGGDASSTAGAAGGGSELDASFAAGDKGLGMDSISSDSLAAMAAVEAAMLEAQEAEAAAAAAAASAGGGSRRGRAAKQAVLSDAASVASADTAATAASRASVPGAGAGVGMGAGGGADGTFASIDGDGPGAGSLKYNGEDLGALVYKALCSLHWGRPVVATMIAPHSLAEGASRVLEAPPGGSVGVTSHPLTLQQCVDKASVGDLATVAEFCAAHRFLMQLATAAPLLSAVASGGDAWVSLERLAAHVLAWNLVEEMHCGAFADIAALGRDLKREAPVVAQCAQLAGTTLQRHHRALTRERARSNPKKRKGTGRSASSARSAMAAAGWHSAAVAGEEGGGEHGDAPPLLRSSEGTYDSVSDTWRFGRAQGLSARGALLLAHEAMLSPAERFEYPTVMWVQGGSSCDLGSVDGNLGDEAARDAVSAAVGAAAAAAGAGASKGTLFDIVTAFQSSPPTKDGNGGKGKDVPPSPAAFPFSG